MFIRTIVLALALLVPIVAHAQSAGRTYRVAVLTQAERSFEAVRSFVIPELAKAGLNAGTNVTFVYRAPAREALDAEAEALAGTKPDAIFAIGPDAIRAAQQKSGGVPVVFFGGQDVVKQGFAPSLKGSDANITGVVILSGELDVKRVELLAEALPNARRYAVLLYSGGANYDSEQDIRAATQRLGKDVLVVRVRGPQDNEKAFSAIADWKADVLVVGAAAPLFGDAERIIGLARSARLPTVCEWAEMARLGCVLGYGPNRPMLYAIAGRKLAQVLRGTPPRDLPIELPSLFEFAINLKEARALGIDLPATIIARADDLID